MGADPYFRLYFLRPGSRFRSSHGDGYQTQANCETGTTLGIKKMLVSDDSEIRLEFDMKIMRIRNQDISE